jgi:hypothetical protein
VTVSEPPVVHGDERTPPAQGADTREEQRAAERAALVALIVGEYPHSWSVPTRRHAGQIADAVLMAGYVRLPSLETLSEVAHAAATVRITDPDAFEVSGHDLVERAVRAVHAALRGSVSGGGNA